MADAELTAGLDASGFERGIETIERSLGELPNILARLRDVSDEPIGADLADALLALPDIATEAVDSANRALARIGTGGGVGKEALDSIKAQLRSVEQVADRVMSGLGGNTKAIELIPGGEEGIRRLVTNAVNMAAAGVRQVNDELARIGQITPAQKRGTETFLGNVAGRNDARLFGGADDATTKRYNDALREGAQAAEEGRNQERIKNAAAQRLAQAYDQEREALEERRAQSRVGITNQQPDPFSHPEQPHHVPHRPAAPPVTSPFAPKPEEPAPTPRPTEPPGPVPFSDPAERRRAAARDAAAGRLRGPDGRFLPNAPSSADAFSQGMQSYWSQFPPPPPTGLLPPGANPYADAPWRSRGWYNNPIVAKPPAEPWDYRTSGALEHYTQDDAVAAYVRENTQRALTEGVTPDNEIAQLLAQHVRESPKVKHRIYRGVSGDYAAQLAQAQPGDRLSMGVSSFTDMVESARTFAGRGTGTILEAEPGARARKIPDSAHGSEREFLSGGNFEVVGKRFDEETQRWIVQIRAAADQFVEKAAEPLRTPRGVAGDPFAPAAEEAPRARPTQIPFDPFTGEQRVVDDLVQTVHDFRVAADETQRTATAQEAFAGGNVPGGVVPPKGPSGGSGSGAGADDEPRKWSMEDMSREEMAEAVRTRADGIAQVGNTGNFVVPDWDAVVRYNKGQKATEESPAVDPHWEEINDEISRLIVSNLAKPGTLGGAAENLVGPLRGAPYRPVSNLFDPNETNESQYALAQRVAESRQAHGGYDPALMGPDGYKDNLQTDFTPVKNSTTLFRDLNDELVKVTRDLATYNVTVQDQITAEKARTEADLRQAELDRGEAIRQGLPGYEQIGTKGNFFNTPQGAPALLRSDGRASIDLNNREQMGADKAVEDEKQAAEQKATADRMYAEALNSSRLKDIAKNNPAAEMRDLGNGFSQLGEQFYKQLSDGGVRLAEGMQELYRASMGLAKKLESQGRSQVDQGIGGAFLGGLFGHGFESNQQFKPADAFKNLAGTAGVLARYGGEGRLLFAMTNEMHDVLTQFESLQTAMQEYDATVKDVGADHTKLDSIFQTGAQYALNETQSIQAATIGLKSFNDEITNGTATAQQVVQRSVSGIGAAAIITGQSADQVSGPLVGTANEFQLGSAGLGQINDAVLNASRQFNASPDSILKGMQEAGDLANIGGFTPERLANTLAAVNAQTGKDSAPQLVRDLAQGGSTTFRTALAQLGVQYNAGDLQGTMQQAGTAYAGLTDKQRVSFATSLGGSRTAETVIAALKEQQAIVDATNKSYEEQGAWVQRVADHQKTLAGQMAALSTTLQDLGANLGKSGLLDGFAVVLGTAKLFLNTLNDISRAINAIPGIKGFDTTRALVDTAQVLGVLRLLAGLGGGKGLLGTTAAADGVAARGTFANIGRGARRAVGLGGDATRKETKEEPDTAAIKEHTSTVEGDTAALDKHAESLAADAEATQADAEATKVNADATKASAEATATKTEADSAGAKAAADKTAADTSASAAQEMLTELQVRNLPVLEAMFDAQRQQAASDLHAAEAADKLAASLDAASTATEENTLAKEENTLADEENSAEKTTSGLSGVGGGIVGGVIIAAIVAEVIKSTYDKVQTEGKTRNAALNAASVPISDSDPVALRKQASDANAAAQTAAAASGGIWGSILNAASGGNKTEIDAARANAKVLNDLASQIDQINSQNGANGQFGSLDLSSPTAFENSLKAVQAQGASTTDQMNLLRDALNNIAKAGQGAASNLSPTDIDLAGATGGAAAITTLNSNYATGKKYTKGADPSIWQQLNPFSGSGGNVGTAKDVGLIPGTPIPSNIQTGDPTLKGDAFTKSVERDDTSLKKVNQGELQTGVNSIVSAFLRDNPQYDPSKDEDKLVGVIESELATIGGLLPGQVADSTRHNLAKSIADSVDASLKPKTGQDVSTPTALDVFNAAVQTGDTQAAQVQSLAQVGQGDVDAAQGVLSTDQSTITSTNNLLSSVGATPADAAKVLPGMTNALNAIDKAMGGKGDLDPQGALRKYQDAQKNVGTEQDLVNNKGLDGHSAAYDAAYIKLRNVTQAANKAKAKGGLDAGNIKDIDKQVADAQAAFDQAAISDIQDQIAIDQSHLALTDQLGRNNVTLNALKQKLANTHNPHDQNILKGQIADQSKANDALQAQTQAAGVMVGVNNAITGAPILGSDGAQVGASFDPRDVTGNAMRQQNGDQQIFNQIDAAEKGLKQHSKDWMNAFMAVQNDKQAVAQDELADANAAVDAAVRPGDAVSAAAAAVQKAKNALAADRPGTAKYNEDQAALNAANYANTKSLVDQANAEASAQVFPGDAVGAATTNVANLTASLNSDAYQSTQWWQDYGALQQAKVDATKAELDAASLTQTLAGDTTDPVFMAQVAAARAKAQTAADAANPKLTGDARKRVLGADTLAERQAQNAETSAAFNQWLSDTQINMQLGRTSFATYMQLLEGRDQMLKAERARMKVGSDGYRQMTDEINQTEQTIHDAMNQLSGQFNLGEIKLPTLYEVRRSLGTAQAGTGYNDNRTVSIVINGIGSTQEVVQVVKQQLGAAATITQNPTSTRKV